MCGFYDDEQKIKKDDKAIYKNQNITILSVKHVKKSRTMDITYSLDFSNNANNTINIPYKTSGFELSLIHRVEKS